MKKIAFTLLAVLFIVSNTQSIAKAQSGPQATPPQTRIFGRLTLRNPCDKNGEEKPYVQSNLSATLETNSIKQTPEVKITNSDTGDFELFVNGNGTYKLTVDTPYSKGSCTGYTYSATSTFVTQGESELYVGNLLAQETSLKVTEFEKDTSAKANDEDCYSGGKLLAWLLCPIVEGIYNFLASVMGPDGGSGGSLFTRLLVTSPLSSNDESSIILRKIWSSFRTIANILFVLVLLFIVFGQAVGIVDNYTIKKAVPRLVLAIIFVQLSYFLCGIIIDFFNILAAGIAGIILGPVQGLPSFSFDGGFLKDIVAPLGTGLLFSVGFVLVRNNALFFISTIFIGIIIGFFVGFITLILRKILILLLIVLAPIAFVAWVMPGTSKFFEKWKELFMKALIMYPLIILFLASGRLAGVLITQNSNIPLNNTFALIANFAPFFLIPATFKYGGSFLAQSANRIKQGLTKMKGNPQDQNSWAFRRKALANDRDMANRLAFMGRNTHGTRTPTADKKNNPFMYGLQSAGMWGQGKLARGMMRFGPNYQQLESEQYQKYTQMIKDITGSGDDGFVYALLAKRSTRKNEATGLEEQYWEHPLEPGRELDADSVDMARRYRKNPFAKKAAVYYMLTKTLSEDQQVNAWQSLERVMQKEGFIYNKNGQYDASRANLISLIAGWDQDAGDNFLVGEWKHLTMRGPEERWLQEKLLSGEIARPEGAGTLGKVKEVEENDGSKTNYTNATAMITAWKTDKSEKFAEENIGDQRRNLFQILKQRQPFWKNQQYATERSLIHLDMLEKYQQNPNDALAKEYYDKFKNKSGKDLATQIKETRDTVKKHTEYVVSLVDGPVGPMLSQVVGSFEMSPEAQGLRLGERFKTIKDLKNIDHTNPIEEQLYQEIVSGRRMVDPKTNAEKSSPGAITSTFLQYGTVMNSAPQIASSVDFALRTMKRLGL